MTKLCSVDGCDRISKTRNLCNMHYMRWWSTGETGPAHPIDRKGQPLHRVEYDEGEATCLCGMVFPTRAHGSAKKYCSKTCKARYEKRDARAAGYARPEQPPCSVEGCEKPNQAKGLCSMHWEKQKKYGDPLAGRTNKPGEWRLTPDGYMRRNVGGRVELQHRVVMEEHLGRKLRKGENIHHINGDRADNSIDNLELWTTAQPAGQRVPDRIKWYGEELLSYLGLYPDEVAAVVNAIVDARGTMTP